MKRVKKPQEMLAKRVLVTLILLPVGIIAIQAGGWLYATVIMLLLGLAAWEYQTMMHTSGLKPGGYLVVAGTLLLGLQRQINGFDSGPLMLSLMVLIGMTYHLAAYERGRDQSASDMGATLMGIIYLGWIGAYLISLRNLQNGLWWTYLTLFTVWAADASAYLVGVRWGRHSLNKRLSPKKTWEGYLGGIAGAVLCGALLGWLLPKFGGDLPAWSGVWIGLAMGSLTILGDLGESMIKRQAGVKDSGHLLPGHGGIFDRIDSWLWAAVISYYLILFFFL